jgi:hypothetical protein
MEIHASPHAQALLREPHLARIPTLIPTSYLVTPSACQATPTFTS